MWRVDRTNDDDLFEEDEHSHAYNQVTAPHALTLGDPTFEAGNVAEPTWAGWRAELAEVGGRSPLLYFVDTPRTRIELSVTHPGGLAQFITGKTTLLSNLIRDEVALRRARIAAGAIAAKGLELSTARGIEAIHLGIGIVEWRFDGVEFRAPLLLRPLAIRRHGRDFEVKLRGSAFLNPALAEALRDQFELDLDADAFVALADDDGTFKPNQVIDRLRGLTSHLEWFNVQPRLVVSSFADVATSMKADAAELTHPVLDALAGNAAARWTVEESFTPVEALNADERPPQTDTLLLDADAEQENVVAQIAAGNSVVVKTLPGTGGTQTIVNAIGTLVGQNKRVLVVSARRATLQGIAQRFADVGLPGLAVAPRTLRRDLIRSISRSEKAVEPQIAEVDEALVRLRKVLLDYRGALARPDDVLGISVLDCVTELSRLALLPTPPSTTARLARSTVEALATDRHVTAQTMVTAATLGEFKYGPGDSPWYGASFASGDSARNSHAVAKRLHAESLPRLLSRARDLIQNVHMRPFENITELGVYLRLLVDLRDTLDKFLPEVFDRSLSELIVATASRREAPEMSGPNRRRLKKLAREYVRPGVHVSDLHDALVRIQQQRLLWQRFVAEGLPPEVPVGIADVQVAYQVVVQDLALLDEPLGHRTRETQLAYRPVADLISRVEALAADSDVLNNLQDRTSLMSTLDNLELTPLLHDLSSRHVPESQVQAELELAWWQSALESLLEADRALLGANTPVLDRLEADFRLVDEAHATGSAHLLGWQLAENWKIGLVDWPDEAALLKNVLRRSTVTAFDLQTTAPHLSRTIAPIWLASPYDVADIADTVPFDAVILVDAGATTLAENVGAIRRARQVVAFGDPVTQSPAPFVVAIGDPDLDNAAPAPAPAPTATAAAAGSAVAASAPRTAAGTASGTASASTPRAANPTAVSDAIPAPTAARAHVNAFGNASGASSIAADADSAAADSSDHGSTDADSAADTTDVAVTPEPPSAARAAATTTEAPAPVPVEPSRTPDELHENSALARLATLLPTLSLTRSYRAGGEDLAELVNRRFYGGKIESLPWAGSFLGHGSLALDYVADGHGMPDPDSGAVESPDAEVDRVVDLVLDHAERRPHESLMVLTASPKHAVRVQQAVLTALNSRTELTDFLIGDRAEPFTVTTIDQAVAQSRDRVIFSIGFGRTPHGRVLSNFGSLGEPGGERLLAVAMTRARRSMVIVTCFEPSDIEDGRMKHGAIALAEILAEVGARSAQVPIPDDSDPMLVDLARRLELRGLKVALGHRGKLGLVAAHRGTCVTIETDTVLHRSTLRESLRLRPELLRRLGWHYLRVHAFELFSDPDAVAARVVHMLGADAAPATEPIAVAPSPRE